MMKNKMTSRFTFSIFISMLLSSLLVGGITVIVIKYTNFGHKFLLYPVFFILVPLVASTFISIFLSMLTSKKSLSDLNLLLTALEEVSKGNFDVKLNLDDTKTMKEIYEHFNIMVKELNSTEILRNDFISNFSHEFKTPIVSIRGFAKLAKDPKLNELERNEYLDIIISEVNRLVHLANHTLSLSKLESQELVLEKKEYNLDEQIRECILILQDKWESKNINFSLNLPNITYYGNQELVQQVWLNLISNAIKYSNKNSYITISIKEENYSAFIEITDEGIGLSEKSINHLFDKFYQADESRGSDGTGLGLSIVKRILDLVHGKIRVTSKLNEGTTFIVELPLR